MISVVITTKNRLEFFKQALNSVINQTYKNIEIIVLDNSSNIETKVFVQNLKNNNIKYIRIDENENNISKIRNIGAKNSNGEYIAFLDDDDIWEEEKLEKQLELIKNDENIALVYTLTQELKCYDNYTVKSYPRNFNSHNILVYNYIGNTSNPLIRKSVFDEINGFDENIKNCEEYELWIRILERYICKLVNIPLVIYTNVYNDKEKLSLNVSEYIKGFNYINDKHKSRISKLSDKEKKIRNYCFYMNVYSKYLMINDTKNARIYLKKAMKNNLKLIDVIKYLLTFLGLEFNIKCKVAYHKVFKFNKSWSDN